MIYLKACEKCRGDVELVYDLYGKSLVCLQCSYTIDGATQPANSAPKSFKRPKINHNLA